MSADFFEAAPGVVSRPECGCTWQVMAHPGPKRRPAQAVGDLAWFLHRCAPHQIMCRSLEQWEIALVTPTGRGNADA